MCSVLLFPSSVYCHSMHILSVASQFNAYPVSGLTIQCISCQCHHNSIHILSVPSQFNAYPVSALTIQYISCQCPHNSMHILSVPSQFNAYPVSAITISSPLSQIFSHAGILKTNSYHQMRVSSPPLPCVHSAVFL